MNSSEADFDQQLHDVCHQADAHIAFDAVAGPLTGQLLAALPHHSKAIVYSALSYKAVEVSPGLIVFEDKAVDGFWLGPWINTKNLIQILMLWRWAQRLMATDLKSEIRRQYPFEEAKTAVKDYLSQMTGGKILLRPNP